MLHTRGSWDQGPTLTILLEKPVPLIGLIARIEGLDGTVEVSEIDDGKPRLLAKRRKGSVRRIKLVMTSRATTPE